MKVNKQIQIALAKGKTREELEKELLEEGYYPPHHHNYDECICVINGAMTFIVDKKEYVFSFGKKLYLPAFTIHESKNKAKEEVVYLVGEKK